MKKEKTISGVTMGKPQKFILHMAPYDNDWAGKIVNYNWDEEYVFESLSDLIKWLKNHDKNK